MSNRLAQETSPYLLQHKDNPVDWWPWTPEAFEEARRRDVPVFLSVGYSACHWCHVMEHESFEDEEIAGLMNRHFVNVKVDREERPDVDAIYMEAVQMMTGRGGWPMSVFMTPDGRPFYGGTYWPPKSRMGMPGFEDILKRIAAVWAENRSGIEDSSDNITGALKKVAAMDHSGDAVDRETLRSAVDAIVSQADRVHGGFGKAPKFPHSMDVRVLLRGAALLGHADAAAVANLTLRKMARGGLYDQLGGGFHRYSTDGVWLAPHFEKMLYDQALLLPAYVEAWQVAGSFQESNVRQPNAGSAESSENSGGVTTEVASEAPRSETAGEDAAEYERVIRETMAYLDREMRLPGGGLAATQDADSDDGTGQNHEGAYFVWTVEEVQQILGEEADAFAAAYDVSSGGNWEGKSILNLTGVQENVVAVRDRFVAEREKLKTARDGRIPPGRDDKVLTNWNGLMISAAAFAGRAMAEPSFVDLAEGAAQFVLEHSTKADGRLYHSFKDGQARVDGFLDDYTALVDGLCELYQARPDGQHLKTAVALADFVEQDFADPAGGAYFYSSSAGEALVTRPKDVQDNAVPSGNALAVTAFQKLGLITGETRFLERADRVLNAIGGLVNDYPRAAPQSVLAAFTTIGPAYELVLAGEGEDLKRLAAEVGRRFLPTSVVLRPDAGDTPAAAVLSGKSAVEGRPTLYVCRLGTCEQPAVGMDEITARLDALHR